MPIWNCILTSVWTKIYDYIILINGRLPQSQTPSQPLGKIEDEIEDELAMKTELCWNQ